MEDLKQIILNENQAIYFKKIVDLYIKTGEPVASKELVSFYKLKVSSATVRAIMAQFEKMGLLEKLHTSGGRIPSTLGLEYYTKYLVYNRKKFFHEKLEDLLAKRRIAVDATVDEAASIISEMAGFTVIATSNNATETLRSIQLTTLNEKQAIVVIVTSSGRVESKMFNIESKLIKLNDVKIAIRIFKERLIDTPLIYLAERVKSLAPILSEQVKNCEIIIQEFIKNVFVFKEEVTAKTFNKSAMILSENISREEISQVLNLIDSHSVWDAIENNIDEDNNLKLDLSRPNLSIISKKIDFENENNISEISVIGPKNLNVEKGLETFEIVEKILKKGKK
ncbi:heat-inducible transcription repressor HrcA [Metamycoplasma subdolum]|uniref:Heat-inducible transcription repressor HrcA n=1 Tax=Metamycoplasma subdolum TaxID=92407 RepID=A0A3M0A2P4_9BACT|nr:heat-inducible transcriptional repressor HrcA [Metamycoplasma subdolum]RMA79090.1 heat-inducible transcription repressor HrcA [Metamycoplasma subdolum]WPB50613.1 heat-inducible transcriptional repressor HrcA [Metamycoplasma subdolum]